MQIHLLASGSDGNTTLITSGGAAILLDGGLGPRQLNQRLRGVGYELSDIQACFFTHEHIDHVAGLRRKGFPQIPLFANRPTIEAVQRMLPETQSHFWQSHPVGSSVQIGPFSVESFVTCHDAVCSVGYRVFADGENLLYATDLGTPSDCLTDAIGEADYIVLESNHDERMLIEGPYPYALKRRVSGQKGHLSNHQTASLLAVSLTKRTHWLALAHLSRTNNLPDLALSTVSVTLDAMGQLHRGLRVVAAPSLASGLKPVSSVSAGS